ncbi:MAG: UDP-N-acetylmuramoyl-tripeptide--D-alanyl-D-alanine ligase [Oligoflexales bacterium]|nr:UDP-N-acetylmuramoyl-tripeptide--D-alanyl-D-alanine ligase [Oligoflexales bacterium]
MNLTFIEQALGTQLAKIHGKSRNFTHCVIDSRSATPGSLFIAFRGNNLDGNAYIESAFNNGALGAITENSWEKPLDDSQSVFEVKDSLTALQHIGQACRRELLHGPLIAIAGSVGKTTSKELISQIAQLYFKNCVVTQGSENGFIGIPLTLSRLKENTDLAIIEVGIDAPGAMTQHMNMLQADFAIVTAIAAEHLETLIDINTVAFEESICLKATLDRGGKIALNLDEPALLKHLPSSHSNVFCYSFNDSNAPSDHVLIGKKVGHKLILNGMNYMQREVPLALPGEHFAKNVLGAVCLANMLKIPHQFIEKALQNFSSPSGRLNIKKFSQDTLLIGDYYNASPASMNAAFSAAAELRGPNSYRTIAVLGDMLELGQDEELYHRELACLLEKYNFSKAYLYGTRMKFLADELNKQKTASKNILHSNNSHLSFSHFPGHEEIAAAILSDLKPHDIILIKGSRSMRMEKVWQLLLESQSS